MRRLVLSLLAAATVLPGAALAQAPKPLYRDPVFDGAADVSIVRDKAGKTGLIYFGANVHAVHEGLDLLEREGVKINALRLRAFPFSREVEAFCAAHERIFVVEQNRDAQMRSLLMTEANVPGLDDAAFQEFAAGAKKNCPISKALAAVPEIVLNAKLVS